jgi:6-phosphogluconate dehydrogenase
MRLAVAGLGRMGAGIARRLVRAGFEVVVWNRTAARAEELAREMPELRIAQTFEQLATMLAPPRCVWLMLPAGAPTEDAVRALADVLKPGDVVIDGGNSFYRDSIRRRDELASRGIAFLDVGTSGGTHGEESGYSLMIGGDEVVVVRLRPLFAALAPAADAGWGRVGPSGAGHFVKMVHNGIEYGLMQAYAEGFELLRSKPELSLDLGHIAAIWQDGSVVRSWLLDLVADALKRNPTLDGIAPWVADSGEGRWAVAEAIAAGVPAPVITLALLARLASRQDDSFAARLVAALRQEFGGHDIRPDNPVAH